MGDIILCLKKLPPLACYNLTHMNWFWWFLHKC